VEPIPPGVGGASTGLGPNVDAGRGWPGSIQLIIKFKQIQEIKTGNNKKKEKIPHKKNEMINKSIIQTH
jgi:hypothetical protein